MTFRRLTVYLPYPLTHASIKKCLLFYIPLAFTVY
nr:MAG TPA: hypothetical protein [Caudoviricetes sp.]